MRNGYRDQVAVIASGLENIPPTCESVNDQYNPVDDSTYSTGCANVEWNVADGCGWLVTVPAPPEDDAAGETPSCGDAPPCQDKVPLGGLASNF